jgi:pimeloyl-ACP methyl ester carboxylesterase
MRADNGGDRVYLVGHSMGGLLIRHALTADPSLWHDVEKVVYIGTPHYGSPAIVSYIKHHLWGFELLALLGRYLSRETFRSLWGVLSLVPAPEGIYPGTREGDRRLRNDGGVEGHPVANFDFFDARAYKLDAPSQQIDRLQVVLDAASDQYRVLAEAHANLDVNCRERMLAIIGVGKKTLFRLEERSRRFGRSERTRKITDRVPGDPHRDGDGRVPVASAQLEGIRSCFVPGVHGSLANLPSVTTTVFDFLSDQRLTLPDTPEQALARHLALPDETPAPHLDGGGLTSATREDPGYWTDTPLTSDRFSELDGELDSGTLDEFGRLRIL